MPGALTLGRATYKTEGTPRLQYSLPSTGPDVHPSTLRLTSPFFLHIMFALSLASFALSFGSTVALTGFASPPAELFSPLVSQKVLKTAQAFPSPAQYPQFTDRTVGNWQWFSPDTWTSGFFPSTRYAMYQRTNLCKSSDAGDTAQWLDLARTWATGEIPLETNTGVGHDVGFLSYPFMDELAV